MRLKGDYRVNGANQDNPNWQTALEHHEELCAERGRTIDVRFNSLERRLDNIERLQRFALGAILAWPALLIAVLKLLP